MLYIQQPCSGCPVQVDTLASELQYFQAAVLVQALWQRQFVSPGLHHLAYTTSLPRHWHPGEPGEAWAYRYKVLVLQRAHAAYVSSISKARVPILFCLIYLSASVDVLSRYEVFARQSLPPRSSYPGLATISRSNKLFGHRSGFKGVGPKYVYE